MQAFPYAAWDDVSAAPLDPVKVTAARKLELDYAENKPVWKKMPRWQAKVQGWGIIKPDGLTSIREMMISRITAAGW